MELERIKNVGIIENSTPEILIRYKNLINEQYLNYRQVKDYASLLNVTPNYLNVLAQKHLGESALSMINNRIVLEIKRCLLRTTDDISQIAYAMNFNELSYFSRFFKRSTRMTPNEFRAEMNKMYQK